MLAGQLLAAAPPPAQGLGDSATVRLSVRHAGVPLPGATVRVATSLRDTAAPLPVVSGPPGVLVLRLPAPGEYRLTISAIGYAGASLPLRLRAAQPDTAILVELEALAEELEELIVSSTRSDRRIEEQPLRVEVLAREEIEEKLLMTPGDISMMLNETGGLRVQTTSPSLGGANVRVQGLRGRYTLLLADGLPLYGGQAGGLGLLQVPPMDLGQVEIIKGASSALYGASAMGGVINLISRGPPAIGVPGDRELLLNATTLGGTDAVGWMTGRLGGSAGYTLLAGAHRQGRRDRDDDGWTDVPGYRRLVLRPRVSWQSPRGSSLFLTAGTTREQRDGGTLDGRLAPDGAPFAEALHTARYDAGAVARLSLSNRTRVVLRGSGMVQRHRHRFGEIREDDRHQTWFAEATVSRELGPSIVVGGVALQGERYRSEQVGRFDYRFSVPGVFLHAELAGPGPLITAISTRLDHHSRYGTFFNPRLSLLARPGEGWSVRVSAGSGYFAPTPFTEETEVTGLTRLAPLGSLVAERARSASLDVQRQAGKVELSATLFGSEIDAAVQLAELAAGAELVNARAPTRTYGADIVARYRSELVGVTASYTWTRATEPHPETGVRREVPLTPRHAAGLVVVHERHGSRRIGLELYYTGRQSLDDQTYLTRSKSYLIVGALAEQRVGAVRVFLNLENLGGVRQTSYAPLVRPAQAPDGRWTTDAWGPLEGRVINGGVRLSW
jgi:outer membrane receptor for ferrienterochelin and colicins